VAELERTPLKVLRYVGDPVEVFGEWLSGERSLVARSYTLIAHDPKRRVGLLK
jgi:hypothetical protein